MADVTTYAMVATVDTTLMQNNGTVIPVKAGTIINRILWDGVTSFTPPDGTMLKADPNNTMHIGDVTAI